MPSLRLHIVGDRAIQVNILHAFDAHAGAQRVAATLVAGLRSRGCVVRLRLGFGTIGFLSEVDGLSRFMRLNQPLARKLFYPIWLLVENLRTCALLASRSVLWLNAVYAVPAGLPALVLAPRRAVIHVHETRVPGPLLRLIAWAGRRGATVRLSRPITCGC